MQYSSCLIEFTLINGPIVDLKNNDSVKSGVIIIGYRAIRSVEIKSTRLPIETAVAGKLRFGIAGELPNIYFGITLVRAIGNRKCLALTEFLQYDDMDTAGNVLTIMCLILYCNTKMPNRRNMNCAQP